MVATGVRKALRGCGAAGLRYVSLSDGRKEAVFVRDYKGGIRVFAMSDRRTGRVEDF